MGCLAVTAISPYLTYPLPDHPIPSLIKELYPDIWLIPRLFYRQPLSLYESPIGLP